MSHEDWFDPLRLLDAWVHGRKSRSVCIVHDNGFGAHGGWEVTLMVGADEYEACECYLPEVNGEPAGLGATILAALLRETAGKSGAPVTKPPTAESIV